MAGSTPYDRSMLVALAAGHTVIDRPLVSATAAALEVEHWGLDAEGKDEADALRKLTTIAHDRFVAFVKSHGSACPPADEVTIAARQSALPDEGAFDFERHPATPGERARTLELHGWARADLLEMLRDATDEHLDWADPERALPDWAWWDTARKMAWHCAITETCYYLRRLDIAAPRPFADLTSPFPVPQADELIEFLLISQDHVNRWIDRLPDDLIVERGDEVWTTRKVLRRLASHEQGENHVTASLLAKARLALPDESSPTT